MLLPRSVLFSCVGLLLLGACSDAVETPQAIDVNDTPGRDSELAYDECQGYGEDTVSARIVWDTKNTYEQEALREAGAPSHVRGYTRREIVIRGDAIHDRRTGKTWMKDPDKFDAWQEEYNDIMDQNLSDSAHLQAMLAWKARGGEIPEVVVRMDSVEFRHPGVTSFRYGLVPGAPNNGERWVDDALPVVTEEQAEVIFSGPAGTVFLGAAEGWSTRPGSYGGVDCELYTKSNGDKTHEFCRFEIGRHDLYLYDSDRSADGERTETVTDIQLGLCISDDMLSAPTTVRFEEWDD